MSSEEIIHPLLDTRTVIQQVKDIQKRHPSLIPNEDDIHAVFDNRNYIVAKALYNNMDGYIEKAGVTADTTIPGTGKNLMGTMNACDYSKPNPSYSCRQALSYYTALQGGGAERPVVRSVTGALSRLMGGGGASPMEAIALDAANERESNITRHKGTQAFKIGDQTINMMQNELVKEEANMKAIAQSFGGIFSSAKNRAHATKNNAYGAAVHDLRMVAAKSTSSEELFAELNNIIDDYDSSKSMSEETKEKLANFMRGASDHMPGYEGKINKVLNKDGFAEAYINKLGELRNDYAYTTFSLAMRDGSAQTEQSIQMALKGIPPGNKDAAKKALHDLGKKIHGEKNYDANLKSAVEAYVNSDLDRLIEKYGNKLLPEEMQNVKRDIYSQVPNLENYEEEVMRMNQKVSLHGSSAQYSLDDPKNLPKRFLEYYAKHVTKNMLHAEGEAGIVKASQYFQGALTEDMIQGARDEYEKEITNKAMYTMGMGFDIGELAPRWKKFNDNEGLFETLSFGAQNKVLGELREELKGAADKIMEGQPDIAKKNVVDNMLDKFYPVPEAQRQKREAYLQHLSDAHTVGNATITTKSLLEKPLSYAQNNPNTVKQMMYTDGQLNAFGQFITEAKHMSSRAFTHPILSNTRKDGTRKSEEDRYKEIVDMVEAVPPEYQRDVFSPDTLSIANSSFSAATDEWSEQKLVGDKYAISKGFDASTPAGVNKIKNVKKMQMELANAGVIDTPQSYRDVIDNMDSLEKKIQTDIGLSPDHIDKAYNAFTDTFGADRANTMMQQREFNNRTPGTSRMTDAGVYNANEMDESIIRDSASKWLSTRKDLAKMKSPPKGSSWAEWATTKGAQGIDKAYKEVETNRIGSKSTTDPIGYAFQSSEDTVVGAMTDLAKKLGREVTYDDLDQYGDPEANEYVQAHMRELKRIAMRSGIIGGRYEALMNARFNDQPVITQTNQVQPQINQAVNQPQQTSSAPQIKTIDEQMNDTSLLSAIPDKLLYDNKRKEYKKRTDAHLANTKNFYDKRLTNENLDDVNRKDSLIKLKAVLEEIKDRKNAPQTQPAVVAPTASTPAPQVAPRVVAPQAVAQPAQAPVVQANTIPQPPTPTATSQVITQPKTAEEYKQDTQNYIEQANKFFSKNGSFDESEFIKQTSDIMEALKDEHPEIAWDVPSESRDAALRTALHEYVDSLEDDPDNEDFIKTVAVLDDLLRSRPEERVATNIPKSGEENTIGDSEGAVLDQNAVNSAAEARRKELETETNPQNEEATTTQGAPIVPTQAVNEAPITSAPAPPADTEKKPDVFSKNKVETWEDVLKHEGVRNDQYVRVGVGEARGAKFKNDKQFTEEITRVNNALDSLDGTENINKKKKLLGNLLGTQTLYEQWKQQQEKKKGKPGKNTVTPEKGSGANEVAGVKEALNTERGSDTPKYATGDVSLRPIEESKESTGLYKPAETTDEETDEDKESKRLFDEAKVNADIARQAEATKISNAPAQATKTFRETNRSDHIGLYKQAKKLLENPELSQADRIQAENIVKLYDETYANESAKEKRERLKPHTDFFKSRVETESKIAGFNESVAKHRDAFNKEQNGLLDSSPQTLEEARIKNDKLAQIRDAIIEDTIGRQVTNEDYAKFAAINSAMEQGVYKEGGVNWKPKQVQSKPQVTQTIQAPKVATTQVTTPGKVSLVDETGSLTKITSPEMARAIENRIHTINAFSQAKGSKSRTEFTNELKRKSGVDDNLRAEMKDMDINSIDDIYRMDKEAKLLSQAKNALINYNREQNKSWMSDLPIAKEGRLEALGLGDVEGKGTPKEAIGKINAFVDKYYTQEAIDKIISEYSDKYAEGKNDIAQGKYATTAAQYKAAMEVAASKFGSMYNADINQQALREAVAKHLGIAHAIYEKLPKRIKGEADAKPEVKGGATRSTSGSKNKPAGSNTNAGKGKAVAIEPPNYNDLNEEEKKNVAQTEATAKKHYDWYTQRNDVAGFKVALESQRAGLFKYIDPDREGREIAPEVQAQLAYSVRYLDGILKELEETKKIPNIPSISGAIVNTDNEETSQVEEKVDSEPIKVATDNTDNVFDEEARSWVRPLGKEMKALKDQDNEVYLKGLKEYKSRFSEATDVGALKNTLEATLKTLSEVKDDDRIKTLAKIRRIEARIQEIGKEERKKERGSD